ncbi:MAG: hypothetical protein M3Y57_16075 [Acidobacteriota bacterium]|nr:hypothetical protein [Acidobacteriota bacterium]
MTIAKNGAHDGSRKNLHASIPTALLIQAKQAASADHISVDELVRDAMERCLGSADA